MALLLANLDLTQTISGKQCVSKLICKEKFHLGKQKRQALEFRSPPCTAAKKHVKVQQETSQPPQQTNADDVPNVRADESRTNWLLGSTSKMIRLAGHMCPF